MSETESPNFDLRLAELKLRALAEFAAGAGHEINNPVATIVGYAQQLLADETNPDRRHALTTIGAQAYRIRDMIGDVMLFARPPEPHPQVIDLSSVVRETLEKFSAEAREASIKMQVEAAAIVPIFADPVQLRVVISSVLRNSFEALESEGNLSIETRTVEHEDRPRAQLSIADDGPGLSAADREHLFDPFYSGRQAGRGLGFGLSKAWRIITLHGGTISVEPCVPRGVAITICWPASAGPAAGASPDEF